MKVNWHGVYPALTTQYRDDFSVDLEATAAHLEKMIAAGIHGVILLGSVGENTAHEYEEKLLILRELNAVVKGRIPVLSGVSENTGVHSFRTRGSARPRSPRSCSTKQRSQEVMSRGSSPQGAVSQQTS